MDVNFQNTSPKQLGK